MERQLKKLLFDIQQSIVHIEQYLGANKQFAEFQKNLLVKRAIEREFEIIGEAMRKLVELDPSLQITYSRKIVGLRNRIAHGYDTVDDAAIWEIIIKNLPLLKTEIDALLIK